MYKLIITGSSYVNKGSGAMADVLISELSKRLQKPRFYFLTNFPQYDKKFIKNENVKIIDTKPITKNLFSYVLVLANLKLGLNKKDMFFQIYQDSDYVVDINGISFSDSLSLYQNAGLLLRSSLGKLAKVKTAFFAQSYGPINKILTKLIAFYVTKKLDLITARGKKSCSELAKIGQNKIKIHPDIAFLLEPNEVLHKSEIKNPWFNDANKEIVGLSLSEHILKSTTDKKNFLSYFRKIIEFLSDKGYNVLLIPHYFNKTSRDDLYICRMLMKTLKKKEDVILIESDYSPQQFKTIIGFCDFFIGTRYHSIVASLSQNIPTITLGWNHKYKEVMGLFGLESYCLDYEQNKDAFFSLFNKLEKKKQDIEIILKEKNPQIKKDINLIFDVLAERITKSTEK